MRRRQSHSSGGHIFIGVTNYDGGAPTDLTLTIEPSTKVVSPSEKAALLALYNATGGAPQGNRILSLKHLEQILLIPAGAFSFSCDADFSGFLMAQEIKGHAA